jgi:hypothetical protein
MAVRSDGGAGAGRSGELVERPCGAVRERDVSEGLLEARERRAALPDARLVRDEAGSGFDVVDVVPRFGRGRDERGQGVELIRGQLLGK